MLRTTKRVGSVAVIAGTALLWSSRFTDVHSDGQRTKPVPVINPPKKIDPTIMKYGFPGKENVIFYEGHVLSYDRRTRSAKWVCQKLTQADREKHKANPDEKADRLKSEFIEEMSIPAQFRVTNADYKGSGYDRGHLAPAGDFAAQSAMDQTFVLTNISPQVGVGFNRDYWARLEQFIRGLTKEFQEVYVVTGPLWLPEQQSDGKYRVTYEVIGDPPTIAVPTHFFKVILAVKDKRYAMGAFIVPNSPIPANTPIERYVASKEQVESASGLTFFELLGSDQKPVALCSSTKCILPAPGFWLKKGEKSQESKSKIEEIPKSPENSEEIPEAEIVKDEVQVAHETFAEKTRNTLRQFKEGPATELAIPSKNAYERKKIHLVAEEEGLLHESQGQDPHRYVLVQKKSEEP